MKIRPGVSDVASGTGLGSSLGGDLGGTLPTPTVVGIQDIPVSSTPPNNGDGLVFDSGSGTYVPGTVGASGGMVPYQIGATETFTVPLYKQALFAMAITIAAGGSLVVDGYLIGVT